MEKNKTLTDDGLLRLDIQFFSDDTDAPEDLEEDTDVETEDLEDNIEDEEKAFSQSDVDRIVKERLARERKKQKEEDDRKAQEEQGKYKELYEQTQEKLAEVTRKSLLESAMLKAGYTEDQIDRYSKYVEGDDEEEITESVQELIEDIAPVKAEIDLEDDPSPYPTRRKDVQPKDAVEYGRQAYERIRKRK